MTIQQFKSRHQILKAKYNMMKNMLKASGFGWDSERNVVLVHDSVWVAYVKQNPKAVDFRHRPLPYYDELVELFEGVLATGDNALSSTAPLAVVAADVPASVADVENNRGDERETRARPNKTREASKNASTEKDENKRPRNGGVKIADAISEVAGEMRRRTAAKRRLTSSQRAIQILQAEYKDSLTPPQLVRAFNTMLDDARASIFVVMKADELRDSWLQEELE